MEPRKVTSNVLIWCFHLRINQKLTAQDHAHFDMWGGDTEDQFPEPQWPQEIWI